MATRASNSHGSDAMTRNCFFYVEDRTYSTISCVGISVLVFLKYSAHLAPLLSATPTSTNLINNQCTEPSPHSPFLSFDNLLHLMLLYNFNSIIIHFAAHS